MASGIETTLLAALKVMGVHGSLSDMDELVTHEGPLLLARFLNVLESEKAKEERTTWWGTRHSLCGLHKVGWGRGYGAAARGILTPHLERVQNGPIANSLEFAQSQSLDHLAVVGTLKSLMADNYVVIEAEDHESWKLSEEGVKCADEGSPEARVFALVRSLFSPRASFLHFSQSKTPVLSPSPGSSGGRPPPSCPSVLCRGILCGDFISAVVAD